MITCIVISYQIIVVGLEAFGKSVAWVFCLYFLTTRSRQRRFFRSPTSSCRLLCFVRDFYKDGLKNKGGGSGGSVVMQMY